MSRVIEGRYLVQPIFDSTKHGEKVLVGAEAIVYGGDGVERSQTPMPVQEFLNMNAELRALIAEKAVSKA